MLTIEVDGKNKNEKKREEYVPEGLPERSDEKGGGSRRWWVVRGWVWEEAVRR